MPLVTAKEIAQVLNLDKIGPLGVSFGKMLMRATKISTLNKIHESRKDLSALQFIDSVFKHLEIDYRIPQEDLKRIPKTGAFIVIANHPLGFIDGMIMMKTLITARPDFKVIGNFLLQRIKPHADYVLPVNPFEEHKDKKSSVLGLKSALRHLSEGRPIGIFPAGEVSTAKEDGTIADKPWEPGAMKLIQKAKVPVIPMYFKARNSRLFYRLSKISPTLRTARLPREMLSQRHRKIHVRIGHAISVKDQNEHKDLDGFTNFLRRKTYLLANSFDKKNIIDELPKQFKIKKQPKQIISEISDDELLKEVEQCRKNDKRLLESRNYEVFLAQKKDIPNIVREIGRLREITFRAVGEGTNKSIDTDKYDDYYHHLFLWDSEAKCIAGAYRMGLGKEIFKNYGIEGFYMSELFRFEPEIVSMISESIEMGRAFIIASYQLKPMPLFLLWKGIVHTTLRFPEHNYLIGGVSISNNFSNFSKSLMIEFMKSHYYDPYFAQYVRPKKEFKVKLKDADKDFVFDESEADLNKFDKIIDEIEPGNNRLPVLLKKYIKQNARLLAFNVDPLFNNSVDGLMYIKIADLPESTVKPVLEEFQAEMEKKYANFKTKSES